MTSKGIVTVQNAYRLMNKKFNLNAILINNDKRLQLDISSLKDIIIKFKLDNNFKSQYSWLDCTAFFLEKIRTQQNG